MNSMQIKDRVLAAQKLLSSPSISKETFDSVHTLLKGINPRIDRVLGEASKALNHMQKIQNMQVIELTAEAIPENTEEQKRRKKYLLLFIKLWKQLKTEVNRVEGEFEKMDQGNSQVSTAKGWGRIVASAQGPLGLVSIAALLIVGFFTLQGVSLQRKSVTSPPPVSSKPTIKVITFNGKTIPLSALYIGKGPDCGGGNVPHYHATGEVAVATDGTKIPDPGACAFGKVSEVKVTEIPQ